MNPHSLIDDIINEKIPSKESILEQKRKEFEAEDKKKQEKKRWALSLSGREFITTIAEQHKQTKQKLITDALDVSVSAESVRTVAIKFALLEKMMEEYYEH